MATGDFTILEQSSAEGRGSRLYNVALGTAILAGEPVQLRALGNTVVEPALTSTPVVGTDYYVGIAQTNSTNTATAAGSVYVLPITNQTTFLVAPTLPPSWDTQAEYDALVGKRMLINNSTTVTATPQNVGSYTVNSTDNSTYGAVVQAIDISRYPGKVAIAFRSAVSNLA